MAPLEHELKELIIKTLALEDVSPDDITDDMLLFGEEEGLGLDSIDALELGVALQKTYDINIDEDDEATRARFATINQLAALVREAQRT